MQALWSHAINPWFDLQMGACQDFRPEPQRTHAVVGIQGLAPYWFEVNGAAFVSSKGDVTARAEAEYDLRITTRVILQPKLELKLPSQDVPELGMGGGMTGASLGLRLRYEFSPQFASYIGAQWEQSFGATKRYARAEGEDPSRFTLVLGTRFWF
ncbi:MAG: copper resistance protein B [Novosphingobium sp.]|mgnify:CR=1 FL=1|jgi:copper resistance protein B|nr:copper resistance protein B [Novosphingobium sp.]MCP5398226.1 copper resistance protein B [Sphingomonas sp.]